MPSKLKKAIGAVKDQTSINIAKVGGINSSASNLEVAILKATSHDESPMDQRYVYEILHLVASNKSYAGSCARAISKRIGKTRSWIVVLKSLMLILRIFQDGDLFFPREILHTMKRGGKILNFSSFQENSNSSPSDFTAYVRMFALYLDDRLECILKGKLQKRVAFRKRENEQLLNTIVRDMKPSMLLDKISYWQRLLDRAIVMRPIGAARVNGLVRLSLYSIIQESFDLYRDISDGLALLLDGFFHLQYQSRVNAFQMFVKFSKQFEDLSSYYSFCKSLGIGRRSEYPTVQKISDKLIDTLREFLKDQASFPSPPQSAVPSPSNPRCSSLTSPDLFESCCNSQTSEIMDRHSGNTSRCTSLEDLMFMTDAGTSPSFTCDGDSFEDIERHSAQEGSKSSNSSPSSRLTMMTMKTMTNTFPQVKNQNADFISFDYWPALHQTDHKQDTTHPNECWELELAKTTNRQQLDTDISSVDILRDTSLMTRSLQTNPFLQEVATLGHSGTSANDNFDFFTTAPTFQATSMPTFDMRNPNAVFRTDDPFSSSFKGGPDDQVFQGSCNRQKLQYEQQLWLRNQKKIIERHMT